MSEIALGGLFEEGSDLWESQVGGQLWRDAQERDREVGELIRTMVSGE